MSELSILSENVKYIRGKVDNVEKKLDDINLNGCSKADGHVDLDARVRAMENVLAKASGAMVILIGLSAAVGALIGWGITLWTAAKEKAGAG